MNITEDYVSFETGKLLKEKGYKGNFNGYYNNAGIFVDRPNTILEQNGYEFYKRPTQALVLKWLREKYNLHCQVGYDFILGWYCQIVSIKETVHVDDYEETKIYHPEMDNNFLTHEEACEAGIKYCLENLI